MHKNVPRWESDSDGALFCKSFQKGGLMRKDPDGRYDIFWISENWNVGMTLIYEVTPGQLILISYKDNNC